MDANSADSSRPRSNYVGYSWDAENRLVAVEPLARPIQTGWLKIEFDYDYQGRRIEKRVFGRASGSAWTANPIERRRFVWGSAPAGNGWLMLREVIQVDAAADGTVDSTQTRQYTWGRDLSGRGSSTGGGSCGTGLGPVGCLTGAGGIGGLLGVLDTLGDTTAGNDLKYTYFYDGNGNVTQLVDRTESTLANALKANYEYDAYGNTTYEGGSYAAVNRFRFSTKVFDAETGMGYWGYRYYLAWIGRWGSRDPAGEKRSLNRMSYVSNQPLLNVDGLGLDEWKYEENKKGPCGTWMICPVKINQDHAPESKKQDFREEGIDPGRVPGFELTFFATKTKEISGESNLGPDCCCQCDEKNPGTIRLIQVIQSPNYPAFVDREMDKDKPDKPGAPPPMPGPRGSRPNSYQDAPLSDSGNDHVIETCAVCDATGKAVVLGCIRFGFSDGSKEKPEDRKVTHIGDFSYADFPGHGSGCRMKPSHNPTQHWKDGIKKWNKEINGVK